MNNLKFNSRGYYSLAVLDADGNTKKEIKHTDNVITYEGAFSSLFVGSGTGQTPLTDSLYAAVGTGTVELTRSSTALGAESSGRSGGVGGGNRASTESDNLDGTSTISITRTFSFELGSKVGTFSEVGVYAGSSGSNIVAGQLIKDEFGSPTTVTLLSDEQLVVTYTLDWTFPNVSTNVGTGTVTDALSNSYDYEVWAQPYFTDYTIGSSNQGIRAFKFSNSVFSTGEVTFLGSDGVTSIYDSGDLGSGFTPSHDGSGTVTLTGQNLTFSPSDFSTTDLKFIGFYTNQSNSNNEDLVNTTDLLGKINGRNSVYVSFNPAIPKTASDSFNIQLEYTLTV